MKRVLVELRVSADTNMQAFAGTDSVALPGFTLDQSYQPVPSSPPTDALVASLAASNERIVLVRGEVDEAREEELRRAPNVVGVWTDARIEPFQGTCEPGIPGFPALEEALQSENVSPFSVQTASPCPPTDCQSSVAKGTIEDVAKYLRCDKLWGKGIRGTGIVVGICDTGVDKTKIPAVIGGWTANPAYPPGTDPGGHGSMCATDVLGMSPDTKIYDIGILKRSNQPFSGLLSDAIAAYQWALEQYRTNGTPQILSNSWGLFKVNEAPDYANDTNHPFTRKVVEVMDAGIIVAFAAGNCGEVCPDGRCSTNGPGKSIWGANGHPKVITVGAANIQEQWIGYTSQGPASLDPNKPDFCAPSHFKGYYSSDSGTSAACPVCAGVIALLKSHFTGLTQDQVKQALQKAAKNLCATGWDPNSGYGMIQAETAFNFLVGSSAPIAHANWVHGSSVEVEFPDRLNLFSKKGFYTLVEGKPDTTNWFHFALPTPVIVDNKRLKLESVILMFVTQPDAVVTNVHIYDGYQKIEAFDGLSMTGSHLFEQFDVLNLLVRYGIGISIGVKFGTQTTNRLISFVSAGGDFIE